MGTIEELENDESRSEGLKRLRESPLSKVIREYKENKEKEYELRSNSEQPSKEGS